MKHVLAIDRDERTEHLLKELQEGYSIRFSSQPPEWNEILEDPPDILFVGREIKIDYDGLAKTITSLKQPFLVIFLGNTGGLPAELRDIPSNQVFSLVRSTPPDLLKKQVEKAQAALEGSEWFYEEKGRKAARQRVVVKRLQPLAFLTISMGLMVLMIYLISSWQGIQSQGILPIDELQRPNSQEVGIIDLRRNMTKDPSAVIEEMKEQIRKNK